MVIRKARETHWEEFCQIQKGEKVLDAGCGNGEYTCWLLSKGAKVWAFDYAQNMVLATEKRMAKYGFKTEKIYHIPSMAYLYFGPALYCF